MSFDDEVPAELLRILERIAEAIDQTGKLDGKSVVRPNGWTIRIFRLIDQGTHRFQDLHEQLGISRNILSDQLRTMAELGILRKVQYSEKPVRFEYFINHDGDDGPSGHPALVRM